MACFVFHPAPEVGKVLSLPEEESHHVSVQRFAPGDSLLVSDGRGRLYRGRLLGEEKKEVQVLIEEKVEEETPPFFLSVWQGLLKSPSRMDWLVEKLTEVGVTEIVFFPAERSLREGCAGERLRRWERIALNACKQSGRLWFPEVANVSSWGEFLHRLSSFKGDVVLADPSGEKSIAEVLGAEKFKGSVALIVGPEGDFTEKEKREIFGTRKVQSLRLCRTILRSETAALFGASVFVAFMEVHHAGGNKDSGM
ncbi:MAG: RsmE family RNA methyltransferase [Candidatus Caldatribacteriaceae bacterium]